MKKFGKILSVLLIMTLVLSLFSVSVLAAGTPSGPASTALYFSGKGTAQSPFLLKTTADLKKLSELCYVDFNDYSGDEDLPLDFIFYSSAHYKLVNNVNLSSVKDWKPFTYFMGVFDGNHKTITNFTSAHGGFMESNEGTVQNLTLKNVKITGIDYATGGITDQNDGIIKNCSVTGSIFGPDEVGLLAGDNNEGSITGCSTSGMVEGSEAGGLVGFNYKSIQSCRSTASVRSDYTAGGLVGYNMGGDISSSHASGNVRAYTVTGTITAGGLVGDNSSGSVKNSYATGSVAVNGSYADIGGLIGDASDSLIKNCRASGDVYPRSNANYTNSGGLIGMASYCSIQYSHASGAVKGHCAGGFVGQDDNSKTMDCYANGRVTMLTLKNSKSYAGGFVGEYCGRYVRNSYYNMKTTGQSKAIGYKIGSRAAITGYNSLGFAYNKYVLKSGTSYKLGLALNPNSLSKGAVSFKSSNTKVAAVDKNGKVTAKAAGTSTITGYLGGVVPFKCTVKVQKGNVKINSVIITKPSSANLKIGKTLRIKSSVLPVTATSKKLKWTSSDNKIAQVDATGKVTGISEGYVTIRAAATDGSGKSATLRLKIVK